MKDAKGHGSNGRGASVAPSFGAQAVESPTPTKPSGIFKPGTEPSGYGDRAAAAELGQGHPKSGLVGIHSASAISRGMTKMRLAFHNNGQ